MVNEEDRCGVWLIGARGGVATTAIVGCRLLARGRVEPVGLATASGKLARLDWVGLDGLVFGGHEVRGGTLLESARAIARENGSLPLDALPDLRDDLEAVDREVRPGVLLGTAEAVHRFSDPSWTLRNGSPAELVRALREDLRAFRERHRLARVVVVNLASTEPSGGPRCGEWDRTRLEESVGDATAAEPPPASVLYAYAAIREGCAYVNFTPSEGSTSPGMLELAREMGVPVAGCDGKTGETLVKTVLAPMFRARALRVLAWQGYNMLGDRDGQVLSEQGPRSTKIRSKDRALAAILGYAPAGSSHIDYVQPFGDRKTAWDYVLFEGFLGHRMALQFTWHGCDAVLAAPLVLDLVRLLDRALRNGESGPLDYLACFFKSPLACAEHDFHAQWRRLLEAVGVAARP